jgi:hypothetical protein
MKFWLRLCAAAGVCAAATNVHAAFHLWQIKEVFTSADGSAQFVEFFTSSPNEPFLNGHNLIITSDGAAKEFVFDHNLSGSTANKHFLVATTGFGSLPGGVTPDYTLATGSFFNPNAANISFDFAHRTDLLEITGSQLPKDGQTSLVDTNVTPGGGDNLVTAVNSPTNFAGAMGSVNLGGGGPVPGDFNDSGVVDGADLALWRTNFGSATATFSQGDADDDDDVDGNDYLVWQRNVGPAPTMSAVSAVPEPAASLLSLLTATTLLNRRQPGRHMTTGEPEA